METLTTFKLLRRHSDGTLHPLFIDRDTVLPMGQWLTARAPDDLSLQYVGTGFALIDLCTQRPLTFQDRRPRRQQVMKANADGCRWVEVRQGRQGRRVYDIGLGTDLQVISFAHRPGWHTSLQPSLPGVDMTGKVWAVCRVPADGHYMLHRNISGLGHREPVDWCIAQRIMIDRLLTSPTGER